jgi:hypothetical protein
MLTPNKDLLRKLGAEPAFRMLISCCNSRCTITYKELATYLAKEIPWETKTIWRHMGDVVGDLMDRIWENDPCVPPINLLIVNGGSKLPSSGSDGHLDRYLKHTAQMSTITETERNKLLTLIFDEVWSYGNNWEKEYTKLFGKLKKNLIPSLQNDPDFNEKDGKNNRGGFGGLAEGPEHKKLKTLVFNTPKRIIGNKMPRYIKQEMRLKSGDEVDVYFSCDDEIVCVEVKSCISSDKDIERGIYQCIKYQSVSQAEEKITSNSDTPRSSRAILVIQRKRMPNKLQIIAKSLDVEWQCWP